MKRFISLIGLVISCVATARAQNARPELVLQIGHMAQVNTFCASPDGSLLVSGAQDRTAKVWDAQSGLLRVSLPQGAPVLALRFTANGTLLCALADGTLRWWNIAGGNNLKTLRVPEVEAVAAALSLDAKMAAFALPNQKIALVETASGKIIATCAGHPTPIVALAFAPDGETLASASAAFKEKPAGDEFAARSGDVRLWDSEDGSLQRTLVGHALSVRALAWSPDGVKLASAGESGTVVLWDGKSGQKQREINITEGKGRVSALDISPDGRWLLAGWRGDVQMRSLEKDDGPLNFSTAESPGGLQARVGSKDSKDAEKAASLNAIPVAAVSYAGGHIAAGGRDGSLMFLNERNGAVKSARSRVNPLGALALSPDGAQIAAAGHDGSIALWNARSGELQRLLRAHTGWVRALAYLPDGKTLISGGFDGTLRFWNPQSGVQSRKFEDIGAPINAFALGAAGGQSVLAVSVGRRGDLGSVKVFRMTGGAAQAVATLTEAHTLVQSLSFSPDGLLLAGIASVGPITGLGAANVPGEKASEVLVWDSATWKLKEEFFKVSGARAVAFSPDGKKIGVAGALMDDTDDGSFVGDQVTLWNSKTLTQQAQWNLPSAGARACDLAFLPDKSVALASRDGAIRIIDSGGKLLRVINGHSGPVASLVLSGDGKTLLSAGSDGTLRVWDVSDGHQRAALIALPDDANGDNWLAVTSDGFYRASPGAARLIEWRVGNDLFPVEDFEKAMRRPANVEAALSGVPTKPGEDEPFAAGQAIPPRAQILLPHAGQIVVGSTLSVAIDASDDKNMKSVELFANGRPVATQIIEGGAKPLTFGDKPLTFGDKPLTFGDKPLTFGDKPLTFGDKAIPTSHKLDWQLRLTSPLPPADSAALTLKAVVTDADGLQGWDEIRVSRGEAGTGGDLYVLSVGVSAYANPAYNLKYAAADAGAFAALWAPLEGKLFRKVIVTQLTDAEATSGAIRAALEEIARRAGPNDVVSLFLSGHGVRKSESEFFFASHDVNVGKLSETAVAWTTFQESLSGSKARRIVLFLDACHSGGALGGRQAGNEGMAEQLVKGAGAVVFASSLGEQVSFELDELKHGAFTQAIIEGIAQGKADLDAGAGRDGVVNVEELLTFLRARVPQLTGGAQMPACPLLRDFGEPFPLARTK